MAEHATHAMAHHEGAEDPTKNALLGVWLGLIALTFFTAVAVGANAYLRSWSPAKFALPSGTMSELPYWNLLTLIVAGIVLLITGSVFRRGAWRALNLLMALTFLLFIAFSLQDWWLMSDFLSASAQVRTAYMGPAAIQFGLSAVSSILLIVGGAYSTYRKKDKIRSYFPVVMNVWLYTVCAGIISLLVTNVVTIGQFGAWCGMKLTGA